jgi:hypothetical protein
MGLNSIGRTFNSFLEKDFIEVTPFHRYFPNASVYIRLFTDIIPILMRKIANLVDR